MGAHMGKGLFRSSYIKRFTIFSCLCFGLLQPRALHAEDFKNCNECHSADLAGDASRLNLHSPFALEQCGKCHAAEKAATAAEKNKSARLLGRKKVKWLADTGTVDTSHGFLLPANRVGERLIIDRRGRGGEFSRLEIAVPHLSDLVEVEDPGEKTTISEVKVLKVERGVFLSATIGWQTDTLTYAQVRYGEKELSKISEPEKRLGLHHEVVLYNLKVDQTYRYSVVATDLFGRTEISEPLEFSTAKAFGGSSPRGGAGNRPEKGEEEGMSSSFKRVGSDYLLELTLEQPAAIYVGSDGQGRPRSPAVEDTASATGVGDATHKKINSQAVISMRACRNCHRNQTTATHPVNVLPKPGMTIPPDYPTLPDGRLTCGSCHISHSSDYEFLARKRGKRELCVGCHKDML